MQYKLIDSNMQEIDKYIEYFSFCSIACIEMKESK